MMSCSSVFRLMQAISEGGSSESEVTAVAVIPCRRLWSAEVITDTAAGKRRIASLKQARSSSDADDMARSFPVNFHYNNCICKYMSIKNLQMQLFAWRADAESATVRHKSCANASIKPLY